MTKLVELPDSLVHARTFGIFDDFTWFISPHQWTKTVADVVSGNGIVPTDAASGILTASPEDATDNDEVYLESTQEVFKFANDKPIIFEARIQFAEAATSAANVFFGLMDAIGADSLVDNGGGPKASYSGMLFFKEDGQTLWSVEASVGSTPTTAQLTALASLDGVAKTAGSASYQRLRIEFRPYSSSKADILFFIDDIHVYKITDFTFTGATEMSVGFGIKNGSTTPETMSVDYLACYQLR